MTKIKPGMGSSNNSNNMIWFGWHGFLTALGTALGHDDCRRSASRRAADHDLGLFRGPSKIHVALSNHVIVILTCTNASPVYDMQSITEHYSFKIIVKNKNKIHPPAPYFRKKGWEWMKYLILSSLIAIIFGGFSDISITEDYNKLYKSRKLAWN